MEEKQRIEARGAVEDIAHRRMVADDVTGRCMAVQRLMVEGERKG